MGVREDGCQGRGSENSGRGHDRDIRVPNRGLPVKGSVGCQKIWMSGKWIRKERAGA